MPLLAVMKDNKMRFFKTVILYYTALAYGMSLSIVGPSLLDLRTQVQSSLTTVTFIMTARAAGIAIGALIGESAMKCCPHT